MLPIQMAMRNRKNLAMTNKAGCYYCQAIFDPKEIKEYTDQNETALCPRCSVDSVIPEVAGTIISEEYLKSVYDVYFGD
jgi:uncharacterized paraquat-inducible protein A